MARLTSELTPQCADVLRELSSGARTTRQLMYATGSIRVGSLIHVLRMAGYRIHTEIIKVRTRHKQRANVAKYTLQRRKRRVAKSKRGGVRRCS